MDNPWFDIFLDGISDVITGGYGLTDCDNRTKKNVNGESRSSRFECIFCINGLMTSVMERVQID